MMMMIGIGIGFFIVNWEFGMGLRIEWEQDQDCGGYRNFGWEGVQNRDQAQDLNEDWDWNLG